MFRPLEAIIRSRFGYPLQDTRILTWWWPPEAETCRLIIKIPYISCNKLFSNSCLEVNLNYYKFVVLDVHTLLSSILIDNKAQLTWSTKLHHIKHITDIVEFYESHWFSFPYSHSYINFINYKECHCFIVGTPPFPRTFLLFLTYLTIQ